MGRGTVITVGQRRALNQALLHGERTPAEACVTSGELVRVLRWSLHMSQKQLAQRSGVPRAHIARLERGGADVRCGTLIRLFDAMFCGLVILPRPRRRPGEAVVERVAEVRPSSRKGLRRLWDAKAG